MDFITLTCPRCQTRMTAVRSASRRLICPRCLGVVDNTASNQQPAPVSVIPLAAETSRDSRWVAIMVVAVAAAILVGVIMAFGNPGTNAGKVILVSILALAIISSINSATGSRAGSARQPTDQFDSAANPVISVVKIILAAIIGIVLTLLLLLGLCAGGILVLSHL
jgi:hypothetical protein